MIVTKQWLNEFIEISDIHTDEICKKLNAIGLEVDSEKQYKVINGIVLGKVLECVKHPSADKLSVCQVDLGSEITQIVCGASNVAAGQFVPVATIGTDFGDGFVIKKAKLRGEESNGMICSSTEIGLPKMNDGILVLDESIGELTLGKPIKDFDVFNDFAIEIELTANRGDCLNIYGVARELGVGFNRKLNTKIFNFPNESKFTIGQLFDIKTTKNKNSNLIYFAADLSEVKIPVSVAIKCAISGKYSENKIEMLLDFAQHSYGSIFDAFAKSDLEYKNNKAVLNVELNNDGFDVAKTNEKELCIVGLNSFKTENENEICLFQASYCNPEILAKKVFESKQKTSDVYYNSSRGSNPNLDLAVKCFKQLLLCCNVSLVGGMEQFCDDLNKVTVDFSVEKLNAIIGQNIPKKEIERILNALSFDLKETSPSYFRAFVPSFRHDIKNIADIAEEIVRIVGIDNIQSKPLIFEEINRTNATSNFYDLKNNIRYKAISNGFFETITYVFAEKDLLCKYGMETVKAELDITNPITKELDTFRTTLLLNLVQAVSANAKLGYKRIPFFEIGKVFNENREEFTRVAFVFSGQKSSENISNNGKPVNITFFEFADKVANVVGNFDLKNSNANNQFFHPYQNGEIFKNGQKIGVLGKLHPSVATDFDIDDTFVCEINFEQLSTANICASSISKFQALRRDLSILVPKDMEFEQITKKISSLNIDELKNFNLIDIYSDEKLGNFESLTLRFTLQSDQKTLEEDEIVVIMDNIISALNELNLNIR